VRTGRETAGPSTALRSGRDDNSVGSLTAIRLIAFGDISLQQNCHPDRSEAQWRDLRFLFRSSSAQRRPGDALPFLDGHQLVGFNSQESLDQAVRPVNFEIGVAAGS
jgi:hypothetical protein